MNVRVIGIDLAVKAKHTAAILDPASHQFLAKGIRFRTHPKDMTELMARARKGAPPDVETVVVLALRFAIRLLICGFFGRNFASKHLLTKFRASSWQKRTIGANCHSSYPD